MATAIYNPTAQINNLSTLNKTNATAGLTTARDKSLDVINTAKGEIAPTYLKQRNTVSTNNQVANRNFAEFMAQRGQNNATGNNGSLAQSDIASNAMLQGNLGSLATGEAKAYTENTKQATDVNTAYKAAVAQSNANIDATTMQTLITAQQNYNQALVQQENTNRTFNAQQAQQALDNQYRNAALARSSSGSSGGGGGSSSGSGKKLSADAYNTANAANQNIPYKKLTDKQYAANYQKYLGDLSTASNGGAGTMSVWERANAQKIAQDLTPQQAANLRAGGSVYKMLLKGV